MRGTSRRRRKRSGGTRRRRGKKEQFTGDVKRSERRIFGNEVSSQRSQSRRRVTGRLIGVNRRGDESAITFLSTRIHSLSLSLTSAFSTDRAGNSGGGNGADPEFVAGKIPDNYTAGMLSAAEPRDTFLPRRVLSLTVAPHAVDR